MNNVWVKQVQSGNIVLFGRVGIFVLSNQKSAFLLVRTGSSFRIMAFMGCVVNKIELIKMFST
jgi:hypothetical protein